MPCYHPIIGWRSAVPNENGNYPILFNNNRKTILGPETKIPCGRCIGCRLEYSRQWAVRCVHESKMHSNNCFITLTYDDVHLPDDRSLHVEHFQRFMKRLRKKCGFVRFFHCGEYGENLGRPHYHAILFGLDFGDKRLFSRRDDINLYTSYDLSKLWTFGFSTVGDCNFDTAAYCARYTLKKFRGSPEAREAHYGGRRPEYCTMSRRPGIVS